MDVMEFPCRKLLVLEGLMNVKIEYGRLTYVRFVDGIIKFWIYQKLFYSTDSEEYNTVLFFYIKTMLLALLKNISFQNRQSQTFAWL